MRYRTFFEVPAIYHTNSGLQITHDKYIAGYFVTHRLTPDRDASEWHTSYPDNDIIKIEFLILQGITWRVHLPIRHGIRKLPYRRYFAICKHLLFIMDTTDSIGSMGLCDRLSVYFPPICFHIMSRSLGPSYQWDPIIEKGSRWLSIHFQPRSYNSYYFAPYGIFRFIPTSKHS